jgi:hypothetical protein
MSLNISNQTLFSNSQLDRDIFLSFLILLQCFCLSSFYQLELAQQFLTQATNLSPYLGPPLMAVLPPQMEVLSLSYDSLSASILDCTFLNCSAGSSRGGGISFSGSDFTALRCLFRHCSAYVGSACYLENTFYTSSGSSLTSLADVSGDGNTGTYSIFELFSPVVGFWAQFKRSNITGNSVTAGLCALWIRESENATVQLCDARLNTGPSCFGFRSDRNTFIRCLSVCRNNCTIKSDSYNGLFFSGSILTISDSVILENTVN